MCGIGGILRITKLGDQVVPIAEEELDSIDRRIAWRGPDGQGRFRDRVACPDGSIVEVALVHRRLSIIDHEGGHQPMVWTPDHGVLLPPSTPNQELDLRESHPDQSPLISLVFNGCIYNHRELRQELESLGHTFTSDHSDTETILHSWREWGARLTEHLEGMYAIVLWDRDDATIFAARDRFGEKPMRILPGDHSEWSYGFASTAVPPMPKTAAANAEAKVSPKMLQNHIERLMRFGWPSIVTTDSYEFDSGESYVATASMTAQAQHWRWRALWLFSVLSSLVVSYSYISTIWSYWWIIVLGFVVLGPFVQIVRLPVLSMAGPRLARDIRAAISLSVHDRLDADVPIAAFLSGGIDSSVIAMCAQDTLSSQDKSLTTVCVKMAGGYDESDSAQQVAHHLGITDHITVDATDPNLDVSSDLITLIETLGLPFGDSSLLPTFWACKAARPHAKVVLSGDGGDELFMGYDRYRATTLLNLLRWTPARTLLSGRLDLTEPKSRDSRFHRLLHAAAAGGYHDLLAIFPTQDLNQLLARRGRFRMSDAGRDLWETKQTSRDSDIAHYLPGDLLRKVDTASMLAGVEVRCPFLDSTVAEAALKLPVRRHYDGPIFRKRGKAILRHMLYERLPRDLVDRPKQGFAIPIGDWLRTDFGNLQSLMMDAFARTVLQDDPSARPFGIIHDTINLNLNYIKQMLDEHWAAGELEPLSGTTRFVRARDHSQRLYMLTVLGIWSRWVEEESGGV
ncbi:MAG: asparagine synthase-related protein [Planctomycetota bacterium]